MSPPCNTGDAEFVIESVRCRTSDVGLERSLAAADVRRTNLGRPCGSLRKRTEAEGGPTGGEGRTRTNLFILGFMYLFMHMH